MSFAEVAQGEARRREVMPARTIVALILVALAAFAGFLVLAAYAPDLRARSDGGAHALSSSAVGYRGATIMLKAMGAPVRISRARPSTRELAAAGLVLTPQPGVKAAQLQPFDAASRILIVLPKWETMPDPERPGFVRKRGYLPSMQWAGDLLARYGGGDTRASLAGAGLQQVVLRGAGGGFPASLVLPLGRMDGLQTISGPGWRPALVDGQGRMVMAISAKYPTVAVLADPDLMNNQGLTNLAAARAGMAVLLKLGDEKGVVFDVTLNGLSRQRSLGRLMLEPPWLAATLCVLATALLMGWHAAARFGAPAGEGRAIALGAAALVDNSAGLIRMARKEAALAPDYAQTTLDLVVRASGGAGVTLTGDDADWLARAAARRGLEDPSALAAKAAQARSRADLMAVADRLYRWRLEMTREHS